MDTARVDGCTDSVGQYRYDLADHSWTWSPDVYAMHGVEAEDCAPSTRLVLRHVHPVERAQVIERFRDHLTTPGPYSCAYRLVDNDGRIRSIVYVGESFAVDGRVEHLQGFVVDITDPVSETASLAVEASAAHRASIEQVKGALMVTYGVSEPVAFSLMRGYSNNHNIRLATLADDMVERMDSPRYRSLEPKATLLAILTDVANQKSKTPESAPARECILPA